jgi:hypothetical protein
LIIILFRKLNTVPVTVNSLAMKTEKELNTAILDVTMKIKEQFPELSKYILEMPVTIPNMENPEINRKVLQDYYNSLKIVLKDYIVNKLVTNKIPKNE